MGDEQLKLQSKLGLRLSEYEAAVFSFLAQKGEASGIDIMALTGLPGRSSQELVGYLVNRGIVSVLQYPQPRYVLADDILIRFSSIVESEGGKSERVKANDEGSNTYRVDERGLPPVGGFPGSRSGEVITAPFHSEISDPDGAGITVQAGAPITVPVGAPITAPDGEPVTVPARPGMDGPANADITATADRSTDHDSKQLGNQVSSNFLPTPAQRVIMEHADTAISFGDLMEITGFKHRRNFGSNHLNPLLHGGFIRRTIPDKPTSSKQKYVLTPNGLALRDFYRDSKNDAGPRGRSRTSAGQ